MKYLTCRALLVPALVLTCTACDDASPLTPREAQAQESRLDATDRALLLKILARLDSIETRAERGKTGMFARLDSLRVSSLLAFAMAPPPPEDPGNSGNAGMSVQISAILSRTDSIMALADFIAKDVAEPWQGFEVCGGLTGAGQVDLKGKTKVTADGAGGLGVKPWDTGAAAELSLSKNYALEFGAGAELEVGVEACVDLSKIGTSIPSRQVATVASSMNVMSAEGADASQLQATLIELQNRLGMNTQSIDRALRVGTDALQSGDFERLSELVAVLPVASVFNDPLATARNKLASLDPVGLLCSGGFGGRIGTAVSDGCGFIQANNLPHLGTFLDLGSNFNNLKTNFNSVCGRLNNVLDQRLVVNNNLPWGTGNILDVRLFPTNWNVTCQ